MSYILVKDLGGKDRGLKFNMGAVDVYWQNLNFTAFAAASIYVSFYAGLVGNDMVKGVESDYNLETVSEWVDKMYEQGRQDEIKEVCDLFANTRAYADRLEKIKQKLDEIAGEQEENKEGEEKKS